MSLSSSDSTLVHALRHAAFHGSPRDGIALLPADSLPDNSLPDNDEVRWLAGVVMGAVGRYADACLELERIAPESPWWSQAQSTRASLCRQQGQHMPARGFDTQALTSAIEPGDRCDALVGLAADAVGLGEIEVAREHWATAAHCVGDDWRRATRAAWVAAEISLLASEPSLAVRDARRAVAISATAKAPRHVAKSQLILGVSLVTDGRVDEGSPVLRTALHAATDLGAWPLVWPAAEVLATVSDDAHAMALASWSRAVRAVLVH